MGATAANPTGKVDESDGTLEQPSTRGRNEDFGPKGGWRPGGVAPNRSPIPQDRVDKDKERLRGEVVANAILLDKVALLSVDNDTEGPMNVVNGNNPVALAT